ncbi:MAG TPA: alpha-ketoglutarate-dependent dioxygenase AlkB [Burkholderiaceae bacterium]|nr:alpha-ketoglutarate-dependent dioxygenase AlkB [Burkholderiaceae bacterium]
MSTLPSDLFGASPQWPRGLTYTLDFISVEEESELLAALRDVPMHDAQYYEYTAKRRVASFGSSYDFESRQLHDAAPVPTFLIALRRTVSARIAIPEDALAQTLITEYRPGTPLGWHRDALNYEVVVGVSLGGRCRMRFRPYPPRRGRDPRTFALQLEPRSMYVMRDDVRWNWQHSIPATPEHRWSITFRTLRNSTSDS